MDELKVLASITDEEAQEFLELQDKENGARLMLKEVNDILADVNASKRKHFYNLAEKYGIDPDGKYHVNLSNKQIFEGLS